MFSNSIILEIVERIAACETPPFRPELEDTESEQVKAGFELTWELKIWGLIIHFRFKG